MDSTLGFRIFVISISFYAFVVQSQIQDVNGAESSPAFAFVSPPPPPPPPPSFGSPPPPRLPQRRNHAPPNQEQNNEGPMRKLPPRHHPHRHPIHLPPPPPPPPTRRGMNAGKKVGFLFIGIAAIMQIGMAGFLVFKRRQLLKTNDTFETHA